MIDFPNALSYCEYMKSASLCPHQLSTGRFPLMKDCPERDFVSGPVFTRNIQVLSSFSHFLICLPFIQHLLIFFLILKVLQGSMAIIIVHQILNALLLYIRV